MKSMTGGRDTICRAEVSYTLLHIACTLGRCKGFVVQHVYHVPPNALVVFSAAVSFAKGQEQPGCPIALCLQAWMLVYPKHTHTMIIFGKYL